MNTNKVSKLNSMFKSLALAGIVAGLSACGGGSSDSSLTLQGTAATGKALAGATITASCASGSGTTTSTDSGAYKVSINGTGPCLITAKKDKLTLHSVADGGGNANITPLTEMLSQYLAAQAGTTVDQLYVSSNGKALLGDTQEIKKSQDAVVALIKQKYNISITAPDFLTIIIVPKDTGTQSNSDKDLDDLMGKFRTDNKVDSDGNLDNQIEKDFEDEGKKHPHVPKTGATGGTSS